MPCSNCRVVPLPCTVRLGNGLILGIDIVLEYISYRQRVW
jgi:hypothetical protein